VRQQRHGDPRRQAAEQALLVEDGLVAIYLTMEWKEGAERGREG
jgi:hypothetical protein